MRDTRTTAQKSQVSCELRSCNFGDRPFDVSDCGLTWGGHVVSQKFIAALVCEADDARSSWRHELLCCESGSFALNSSASNRCREQLCLRMWIAVEVSSNAQLLMSDAAEALRLFRREVAQEHAFLRREALFALSFDLGHDPLHLVTV